MYSTIDECKDGDINYRWDFGANHGGYAAGSYGGDSFLSGGKMWAGATEKTV
jgi:hypothetical protein